MNKLHLTFIALFLTGTNQSCGVQEISSELHGSRNGNGGFVIQCKKELPYFAHDGLYSADYAVMAKEHADETITGPVKMRAMFEFKDERPNLLLYPVMSVFFEINSDIASSIETFTKSPTVKWTKSDKILVSKEETRKFPQYQHKKEDFPSNCDTETLEMVVYRRVMQHTVPSTYDIFYQYLEKFETLDSLQQSFVQGHEWLWDHNNTDNPRRIREVIKTNMNVNWCLHEVYADFSGFSDCFFQNKVSMHNQMNTVSVQNESILFSKKGQTHSFKNVAGGNYLLVFNNSLDLKAARLRVFVDGKIAKYKTKISGEGSSAVKLIFFQVRSGDNIEVGLADLPRGMEVAMISIVNKDSKFSFFPLDD